MAQPINLRNKASSCSCYKLGSLGVISIIILVYLWAFTGPWTRSSRSSSSSPSSFSSSLKSKSNDIVLCQQAHGWARIATGRESRDPTFYDDRSTGYSIDDPVISKWDQKRKKWFKLHPTFSASDNRVLVVTGSQSSPCKSPVGDHLLLRSFKNKVDYCRIHGYEIFYNNAYLQPQMQTYWAKIPIIRAAMVAHPEVEWVFWVDSDAIFTDMDFEIPFDKYDDHNLVVTGWPELLYKKRSWLGVNAGVFLMRNCEWSMALMEVWAGMGPKSPEYEKWGELMVATFKDKKFTDSDDQSALVYLILEGEKRWREKIYLETEYPLNGYWVGVVDRFDEFVSKYGEMEKRERRHAEVVREGYAAERGRRAEEGGWRRHFVTHFAGCQPCSGKHNEAYDGNSCVVGMERALNFADNQVLSNYGFVRTDLRNTSFLSPLPFHAS